jgi:hypothetical protein
MDGNLVSSLVSAFGGLKALLGARDQHQAQTMEIEFNAKVLELQRHLLAQSLALADKDKVIGELQEQLRAAQADLADRKQMALVRVGSVGEFFAYIARSQADSAHGVGSANQFFCQACFAQGKRIVLTGNGEGYWSCPVCRVGAQTEPGRGDIHASGKVRRMDGW